MEKKITKKLLAILMIITILATDFFVLGSNLITYATQVSSDTSNQNIEFSAYFKDGENKVDSIGQSIKSADLKLYAKITVNGEDGYLEKDATIEIQDSNFNIISTNKGILKGNKVTLNQINAGETVEVELGIEPIIADKISTDFLAKTSIVKFTGSYKYSEAEEGIDVNATKSVCVNYQPDESAEAEIEAEIITNKVLAVNGTNKRVVQLLAKSSLTDNQYPIEQTVLNVGIPKLNVTNTETGEVTATAPETVNVLAIGKLATNGETEISEANYTVSEENVQITLKNEADGNKEISWIKNAYDELVVTYIYPEAVNAKSIWTGINSELKVYGEIDSYKANFVASYISNNIIGNGFEKNQVLIGKTEITTEELYKGQIYANAVSTNDVDIEYETKTTLAVTIDGVVDKITINEGQDEFGTADSELTANTKYISTEINKEKMLAIVGQGGSIEIKNGENTTTINKDTTSDENGNIVITHGDSSTSELVITARFVSTESEPTTAGVLEIYHTKAITENSYNRDQIKTITTLKAKGTVVGTKTVESEEQKVVENSTETTGSNLELKETTSKAELMIDKTTLSTTEANEVTVGITLVTDDVKYDLYKNPTIELQMPAAVENVEFIEEPTKLYDDSNNFGTVSKNYDSENNILRIGLSGEQTAYPQSSLYIPLKLNITLDSLAISGTDKITMKYTNQNASQYESATEGYGIIEQAVEISAPNQLIKMFNVSSNDDKSTEDILQEIKTSETLDFEIALKNNKDIDLSNVKILGKLPTAGNTILDEEENTLQTTLKSITAENATIYYTENVDASEDIEDTTNGWNQEASANAKLYLIKLDSLARGASYTAKVSVQMPATLDDSAISYTQYEVGYDTATATDLKEYSRKIGLMTSVAASIKTEITAKVGQDEINDGDTVKEGEVIRYTVTLHNKGKETLENVQLKLDVPEGTVYVKPMEEYTFVDAETGEEVTIDDNAYIPGIYYEEITNSEQLAELTVITIPKLTTLEQYEVEYEVRVNKETAGIEILNKPTVIYDGTSVESSEIKNIIEKANVRVTIKSAFDKETQVYPGGTMQYFVYVENLSNSKINNLEMETIANGYTLIRVENEKDGSLYTENESLEKITIEEIPANEMISIVLYGDIDKDIKELEASIVVHDSSGNKYRSNALKEELIFVDATINLESQQKGKTLKQGDLVEYNITVKNTGEHEGYITIKDVISDYMQVQAVKLNKETVKQTLDSTDEKTYFETIENSVYEGKILQPGETMQVDITAKVGYVPEEIHGKSITNIATVECFGIVKESSQVVTHILISNELQDENIENVISGFAWYDENGNGQRDANEEVLSNITVKLFDNKMNNYVINENGNTIKTETDINGEYTFTKIDDGSYLIIFEYDTSKYVFTTANAEGVDTSMNSKVSLKHININGQDERVAAIELSNLKQNVFNMNIGLKDNTGDIPEEEQPTISINPENPENPGDETKEQKTISGCAWLDSNRNGQKDNSEEILSGITVTVYDVTRKEYIASTITDNNGKYVFENIEKGSYILIFEYDTEKYEPTTYMAEGVNTSINSKAILNKININGQEKTVAVTDTINVQENISNINIGLIEKLMFDLELDKYISRIVVQNDKGTKAYDYDGKTLAKVEIHKKQLPGSLVVLEYTIKVKNTGEVSGFVKNIVDYLPAGLTFSSELNTDWYISDNNLYTKSLENVEIKPGEEREIKLILTKTMTNENTGLINNRAEIYEDYNKYGNPDIDSIPNNQVQDEDDFGYADVIIGVSTGGSNIAYFILLMINALLIGIAIKLMINNNIIKISRKAERR